MDSLGNIPLFISILKDFDPKTQRKIILREMIIALMLMILFLFFGKGFLSILNIKSSALQITGGIILFLISIKMVFSSPKQSIKKNPKEPLIVPLAVPLVAGPGILAFITLYGGDSTLTAFIALVLAWGLSLPCLLLASFFKSLFGDNGLVAIERLFGYIIVLISAQMAINGLLMAFKPT